MNRFEQQIHTVVRQQEASLLGAMEARRSESGKTRFDATDVRQMVRAFLTYIASELEGGNARVREDYFEDVVMGLKNLGMPEETILSAAQAFFERLRADVLAVVPAEDAAGCA